MTSDTDKERANRLRWAIERKFKNLPEAHAALKKSRIDVSLASLTHHQNGTRGFKAHAEAYASALGVSAAWLLWGTGTPDSEPTGIPILGQVAAGGENYRIWDYDPSVINDRLPAVIQGAEMALPIRGESMHPRFKEGEYIIAGAITHDIERWIGRDVVAQTADGRIVLKTLWRCPTGRWTLESVNPMFRPIEDVDLDWVRPVLSNLILPH